MGHRVKPTFWRLILSTPSAVTWTCEWHDWLSPSSSSLPSFLQSASSPGVRVSNYLFFICGAFSLACCLLPFFQSNQELLFSSPFLSKHVMRVALYLAHWLPIWLPRLLSHWSGSRTVPWPSVLRLLASAKLQLYQTSLPRLIISI